MILAAGGPASGVMNLRALPLLASHPEDFAGQLPEELPAMSARVAESLRELLDLQAVEEILADQYLKPPLIQLVRSGAPLPPAAYTNAGVSNYKGQDPGQVNLSLLRQELQGGTTLILNKIFNYWRPVGDFCRRLSYELGSPVNANSYLTPAGAQGYSHHHDTHSAFIVQLYGRKVWRLYRPARKLPLEILEQTWQGGRLLSDDDRERIYHGEPDMVCELAAGDALWLPRGWIHDVFSTDCASLHLTLGILPVSGQALLASVRENLIEDEAFRRSLPVNFSRSAQAAELAAEQFLTQLRTWIAEVEPSDLSLAAADRLRAVWYPPRCQPVTATFLTDEELAGYDGLVAVREAVLVYERMVTGDLQIDTGHQKFVLEPAAGDLFGAALAADDAQPVPLERYRAVLGTKILQIVQQLLGAGVANLVRRP